MLPYFVKYGDSSGGSLNDICDKFQIASRKNSIAVISLQQKHKIFSEEELLAEVKRVDLLDGILDGKMSGAGKECAECGRVMHSRHARCLYCGARRLTTTAFDEVV